MMRRASGGDGGDGGGSDGSDGSDGDVSSSSSPSRSPSSPWPTPRHGRRMRGQSEASGAAARGRKSSSAGSKTPKTPPSGAPRPQSSRRSVRDPEQGVYEYLEERVALPGDAQQPELASLVLLPVKLSGWLWRREGLFRKYRRRFCVFKAESSALFVFAGDDTVNGKLLRRVVVTHVRLESRQDRALHVQGYAQNRELHKKQSDSMAHRASSRARALPGDRQRFFLPEDEHFKAVTAKSLAVWTHCFKHHMKSYRLRKQRRRDVALAYGGQAGISPGGVQGELPTGVLMTDDEDDDEDDEDEDGADELDPDFVYEEVGVAPRRHSLPANPFRVGSERTASKSKGSAASSSAQAEAKALEQRRAQRRLHPDDKTQLEYDQDHSIYITKLHRGSFGEEMRSEHQRQGAKASKSPSTPPLYPSPGPSRQEQSNSSTPAAPFEASQSKISYASSSDMPGSSTTLSSLMWSTQSIWADEALLEHRIDFDAVTKSKQLATGAYGEVWLAQYRGRDVVLKHLKELSNGLSHSSAAAAATTTRRATQRFVEEIKIHMRLEHKRIVSFRGVAWTKERDVQLVMEYLPKGDLRAFLDQVKQVRSNKFSSVWTWTKYQWRIAIDVIEGLVYLHSLSPALVHSDLKSGNILLQENMAAKIGDFGLSRYAKDSYLPVVDGAAHVQDENDSGLSNRRDDRDSGSDSESKKLGGSAVRDGSSNSGDDNSFDDSGWFGRAQGTGRWMAPEVLTGGRSSTMAADVYAFGVVLSEIDTCEIPFRDRSLARSDSNVLMSEDVLVHHIVAEGWKPTFRVTCPDAVKQLATECLARNPSERPTSLEVAHRLRKAASQRERPEVIAAQAASLRIRR